ncbi:four helix bundle protein [Hyunsoonleella sp. 2307UL5-6]|uniref:four helix bundle protein n=1 Tax=Hyunsoonleella sp. 2307UL5-6 TaxID=3384768 RepID=UPI0039BD6B65
MNKFEDLLIWKKSMDLVEYVYLLSKELPNEERFGLISQIRRCSVSIPSNIAEGAGRNSKKEFVHFLSIANGSTSELKTQLLLSLRLNFTTKEKIEPLINLCNEIQKMNRSLQNKLN